MSTSEPYFSLVRISRSTWIAVHVNQGIGDGNKPLARAMFSQTEAERSSFTERFPRLMIAMISLALLAATATAEVELLKHAGYIWR